MVQYESIDSQSILKGCTYLNWGSYWWIVVILALAAYSFLIPGVMYLSFNQGSAYAEVETMTVELICTMIVTGIAILAGIVNMHHKILVKDGPLGYLMNKRIGKPSTAKWMNYDWYFIGPLNEFLSLSYMEAAMFTIVIAWIAIAVWARYTTYMNATYGAEHAYGNKTRAFGRAMNQASLRLMLLALISPQKNAIMIHFLGIAYERAIKWHKIAARLFIVCIWIHVIAMLIGGTELGYTRVTGPEGQYYNTAYGLPEMRQVKWTNKFTLYGMGTNLACGPIAFFFWNLLALTSLPYMRRKLYDWFWFLHYNCLFPASIMTVFHSRTAVIPWLAPAFVLTYIDLGFRLIAKFSAVKASKVEVIGDNIVKLVLSIDKFPRPYYEYHAGSYIWLSCNIIKNKSVAAAQTTSTDSTAAVSTDSTAGEIEMGDNINSIYAKVSNGDVEKDVEEARAKCELDLSVVEGVFSNVWVPGGPPAGLPSWLFFHPITITSYDQETNQITLYIKAFGGGKKEWSGQLLEAAKLIEKGEISIDDIGFHVGGPHGSLIIKEPLEEVKRVVMVSGGIGCTPMCAVLEDLLNKSYSGKADFIWSTRSKAELDAFTPLFHRAEGLENFSIKVYYTGKDGVVPSGAKGFSVTAGRPNYNDLLAVSKGESTGMLCCGPEEMMYAVEGRAVDAQKEGCHVLFHRETFDL